MDIALSIRDLNVTYINRGRKVMAVKNFSIDLEKGQSLGIVGESGSGKSTLVMALLRLLPEKSTEVKGSAMFLGKDLLSISQRDMNALRWEHIAVVFQKAMNSLSPVHRISTQIEDIYHVHKPNATREEIHRRMAVLLKMVNLQERVYTLYPHEMSGGMLQRVAIAMSLIHSPELLIVDEATTALDVVTQGQILNEIVEMEKKLNMTRIMITHDMSVVASSCSKICVMYAGEFMEAGDVRTVLTAPRHPYTKGLLASFPSLTSERAKLSSIPGFLPDLSQPYPGCMFAPRCAWCEDRCRRQKPPLQSWDDGDTTACWHYGG